MDIPIAQCGRTSQELEWICRAALQEAFPAFRGVRIEARFYPYIGLTHTIRRTDGGWVLRISDHCRRAPRQVLEAIALLLASKVLRRRAPARVLKEYAKFRRSAETTAAVRLRRQQQGRKIIGSAEGRHHSLSAIFDDVNERCFGGRVEVCRLGWGPRRSWSRLGHYDPVHHTITISPVLDSAHVPRSVVAYLVYHEMLHTLFESDCAQAETNRHHPAGFRKAERSYPDYESAKRFLANYCRTRGK